MIAIGGEDTLGVAHKLSRDGVQVVGVPKTIDNDLSATDFTFGFHTAVQIATDAIDRLHTTAESHDRVMVVEVMGRHAGWIATYSGLAGGADVILVPETPFDIQEICGRLTHRHELGANFSIVVVAEGATPIAGAAELQSTEVDAFGHVRLGGVGNWLQQEIEKRTGYEARMTQLGHVLRGGTPDRVRPRDRDAIRCRGDRRGARRRLREDGGAPRNRRRARPDRRRRRSPEDRRRTASSRPPPSSSGELIWVNCHAPVRDPFGSSQAHELWITCARWVWRSTI